MRFRVLMIAAGMLAFATAPSRASPGRLLNACEAWIDFFEQADHLPPGMLRAIGVVESGRRDPQTKIVAPWPWTINVAGRGQLFDMASDAIAASEAARIAGIQSIDVGCMQVNLAYHPRAFATLDQAFQPAANVAYAAAFLMQLHAKLGSWASAIAAYHSSLPSLGPPYARVVASIWPLSERYGLLASDTHTSDVDLLAGEIDPGHVLTPAFRAEMQAAAAFARQHGAGYPQLSRASAASAGRPASVSLAAAVDPAGTLTPAFRARMIEAEAFRRQINASYAVQLHTSTH